MVCSWHQRDKGSAGSCRQQRAKQSVQAANVWMQAICEYSACILPPTRPAPGPAGRRSMLADRLLAKGGDYECDRELRTLELLKVRFGEGNLHNAEVMLKVGIGWQERGWAGVFRTASQPASPAPATLPSGYASRRPPCHAAPPAPLLLPLKDLADSKRINANVKSVPNTATPLRRRRQLVNIDGLSATIVSQLFWPTLPQDEFNLPPEVCKKGCLGEASEMLSAGGPWLPSPPARNDGHATGPPSSNPPLSTTLCAVLSTFAMHHAASPALWCAGASHAGHLRCQVPLAQGAAQAAVEAQPGHGAAGAGHWGPEPGVQCEAVLGRAAGAHTPLSAAVLLLM